MKLMLRPKDYLDYIFKANYKMPKTNILCDCQDVDMGDVVNINGSLYVIKNTVESGSIGLVEPITITEEPEEKYECLIKCPVCGHVDSDSWERQDDDDEYECGNCGSILSYTSETTRSFTVNVVTQCKIKSAIPDTAGNSPASTPAQQPHDSIDENNIIESSTASC